MSKSILQTKEWQKLQQDLGETTFFEQNKDFSYLAILKNTPVGSYLYLPYGPVAEELKFFKKALKSLKELAFQHGAMFIRIEPQNQKNLKFLQKTTNIKKSHDLNPADTWILNLSKQTTEILPKRLVRYHRTMANKNISVVKAKTIDDIDYLINLQKNLSKKKNINTFSKQYLSTELKQDFATLYLVRQNSTVLAAGLVFDDKKTRYNIQGAQSYEGTKLHATGILTIQLILDAKEKGLKNFDFWGIAPDDAPKNHPWAGFTDFKKSFGGEAVHYCGTWDVILNPTKYRLYQILRKINKIKRKFIK